MLGEDVVAQAEALLGCLVTSVDADTGERTVARIVETEAYRGRDDRASHAYAYRRTPRTEVFFGPPGHAYVYLCYGIHRMFNVIAGPVGEPNAVLVRAVEPVEGVGVMLRRRRLSAPTRRISGGPGLVCQALGIGLSDNGADLLDPQGRVRLDGPFGSLPAKRVTRTPRVGVAYAGEAASWPWRFRDSESAFTSPAK